MVLVPIDGAVAAKLMAKYPFYALQVVPTETYKGQTKEVTTVAVKSMLAVSSKLPADLVYQLLETLFNNTDRLIAAHAQGKNVKLENRPRRHVDSSASRCREILQGQGRPEIILCRVEPISKVTNF